MVHFDGDNIDHPTTPIEKSFARIPVSTKEKNEQSHHHLEELLIILAIILVGIALYFLMSY